MDKRLSNIDKSVVLWSEKLSFAEIYKITLGRKERGQDQLPTFQNPFPQASPFFIHLLYYELKFT